MTASETLQHEHQIITVALRGMERTARSAKRSGAIRAEIIEQIVDFARNFVDACHHAKEEKHLFIKLAARGVPVEGGLIGELLAEHQQGRQQVRAIHEALPQAAQGESDAIARVAAGLASYVETLRAHIAKENRALFPLADSVLTAEDQASLGEAFERVELEEIGAGVHEKYHQMAHALGELPE